MSLLNFYESVSIMLYVLAWLKHSFVIFINVSDNVEASKERSVIV